jgi:hypothetical protein
MKGYDGICTGLLIRMSQWKKSFTAYEAQNSYPSSDMGMVSIVHCLSAITAFLIFIQIEA